MIITGVNDLATLFPEILTEWDYEKNKGIYPTQISAYSSQVVYWKCSKGHEWEAKISSRTNVPAGRKRPGCPYCNRKRVIVGENDLVTVFPDVVFIWDYEKNDGIAPENCFRASMKKVWWKCQKCGYEWRQAIGIRVKCKNLCPQCMKKERIRDLVTPEQGYSLQDVFPNIAKEWNYERNNKSPLEYRPQSGQKVWWKCSICKHEWQARISGRTKNHSGCPECAKEMHVSFPEKAVFYYINKYNKQGKVLENYKLSVKKSNDLEIDVYLPLMQIGIEYDGQRWHKTVQKDKRKDEICIEKGITLIRIREPECAEYDSSSLVIKLESLSEESLKKGIISVLNECFGDENLYDVSISRDRYEIYEYINLQKKKESLKKLFPQIAVDWNYEKNGKLEPDCVSAHSGRTVWWKCHECNYEWESQISSRTGKGTTGCPRCSWRGGSTIFIGVNDFATLRPDLALEWDYEKNNGLTPQQVTLNSHTDIWWKCKHGHRWHTTPNARINNNTGCPVCSKKEGGHKRSLADESNSLMDLYPEVALDWDYDKNVGYTPETIIATSGRRMQWKCHICGNTWKAVLRDRTVEGYGCPFCNGKRAISGVSDLKTIYPEIANEWDYQKNGDLSPESVLPKSNKSVFWICPQGHSFRTRISSRTQMNVKCPICSGHKVLKGYNDLATRNPELAEEWDYENNGELKPTDVTECSAKKIAWICKKGHRFISQISTRTSMKTGCPYCSGKRAFPGETDFMTLYPDVAKEWDYSQNTLDPLQLRPGSNKVVWWKCQKCGKAWKATVNDRTNGYKKCPSCFGKPSK